jgi:hypothetical protein
MGYSHDPRYLTVNDEGNLVGFKKALRSVMGRDVFLEFV